MSLLGVVFAMCLRCCQNLPWTLVALQVELPVENTELVPVSPLLLVDQVLEDNCRKLSQTRRHLIP